MSKDNSETTEYVKQSGACAAVVAVSGSQHAEMEFPAPVENPMPAAHYVATGTYKAPAPDASAAAPKKGGAGYLAVKRAFDIVFSAGVCIVLAIPVAAACVAIVADTPGKPFFRQERIGQGGKKIYIFKLRTMVSDAHEHPEKYMTAEQLARWEREQKVDDDPRVTRVGRFLRRTSLDELPQFLNVLTGDIPLRILKTRPEFSEKSMGAFALPAKSSTNKEKAFSQVVSCFASSLRMRRISGFNCKRVGSMGGQFLAKPVFKAVCA
ncbi:sugar transferase [Senegalimassilia anaerobia]|uniref:sugar transferase n=1 Tax=Senegalimassilia anaerobia TaxID=1473216 RepID=UPI0026736EBF|nr:sugar transferase [Senegalimassilia anaerobia]